ncbi:hypothetical protein OIU84_007829 [Salix udensis]|uniref:Uncharacterized protein n=1 Tax=Salix udensis TaxID=889485 RepID=A0AAD6NZJ3_9ROSI|nr:hypothetical protein OIU84_007829 [Salix udensis]
MSVILAHGLSPPLIEVMMAVVLQGTHSVLPNSNQYIPLVSNTTTTNQSKTSLNTARKIKTTPSSSHQSSSRNAGNPSRCGSGPNVAILPQGIIVNHCGTAAKAAQFMATAASVSDGDISKSLEALALRKTAQAESDLANFSKAEELLSLAIDLQPFGGIHVIYKYRSLARLAMRNYSGALEDAREALRLAPRYLDAYMCEGDVFMAMEEYDAAEKAYLTCLQIDPSIRRSKSFKTVFASRSELEWLDSLEGSLHPGTQIALK